jgi:hypothetical protein
MVRELRQMVMDLAALYFPELAHLTQSVARTLTRPEFFRHVLLRLPRASDAARARQALLTTLDEQADGETQKHPA